jgi:hypothetical protein
VEWAMGLETALEMVWPLALASDLKPEEPAAAV